jgi:F-box interacting protein
VFHKEFLEKLQGLNYKREIQLLGGKMSILPQELITQILLLLPVKPLLRFQCVSKSWSALISDPYFIKIHAETNRERSLIVETFSYFNPNLFYCPTDYYLVDVSNEDPLGEPVNIFPPFFYHSPTSVIGCCNGLVCIRNYDYEIVIWNPSIKKHKTLPFVPIDGNHEPCGTTESGYSAFGYDPVNNDYKILRIVKFHELTSGLEVKVYIRSLKAHTWRKVEDEWPYKEKFDLLSGPVFSYGTFHWLVTSASTGAVTLLAFDLTTYKFGVQTFPFGDNVRLDVLAGSLCVTDYKMVRGIDVYMMKDYRVATSWSWLFMVPYTFLFSQLLMVSNDGEKVLMLDLNKKLFWYDIEKETDRIVGNDEHFSNNFMTWRLWSTCAANLLLLDGESDALYENPKLLHPIILNRMRTRMIYSQQTEDDEDIYSQQTEDDEDIYSQQTEDDEDIYSQQTISLSLFTAD